MWLGFSKRLAYLTCVVLTCIVIFTVGMYIIHKDDLDISFSYKGNIGDISMYTEGLIEVSYKGQDNCVVYITNIDNENKVKYKYVLDKDETLKEILTDGNGTYEIEICNVKVNNEGKSYISGKTEKVEIPLNNLDEQIFTISDTLSVPKISEENLEIFDKMSVNDIYDYFCTFKYNKELAEAVSSGIVTEHRVDVDDTIESKKGVCVDLAASMTSVLRNLGIPCKLVYGYVGSLYHSWVEVYDIDDGWISYDPTNHKTSYEDDFSSYIITEYH